MDREEYRATSETVPRRDAFEKSIRLEKDTTQLVEGGTWT
jgi:hypothetical protein